MPTEAPKFTIELEDGVAQLPRDEWNRLVGGESPFLEWEFLASLEQADALDESTFEIGKPIDVVLDLDVPREIVLERISSRRVCRDCGTNYTASGNDPSPWICDVCGGDVMQRDDDTPVSVNRRLDI